MNLVILSNPSVGVLVPCHVRVTVTCALCGDEGECYSCQHLHGDRVPNVNLPSGWQGHTMPGRWGLFPVCSKHNLVCVDLNAPVPAVPGAIGGVTSQVQP